MLQNLFWQWTCIKGVTNKIVVLSRVLGLWWNFFFLRGIVCFGFGVFSFWVFIYFFANLVNFLIKYIKKPKSKSTLQNVSYIYYWDADCFSGVWLLSVHQVNTTFCRQSMLYWPWCLLLMILPKWLQSVSSCVCTCVNTTLAQVFWLMLSFQIRL